MVCGLAQGNGEEKLNNKEGLNVKINKINHDFQVARRKKVREKSVRTG